MKNLYKKLTVVFLFIISLNIQAVNRPLEDVTFKQLQQDMLVYGVDFEYLHGADNTFQLTEVVEPLADEADDQAIPEELEHALSIAI